MIFNINNKFLELSIKEELALVRCFKFNNTSHPSGLSQLYGYGSCEIRIINIDSIVR